MFKFHFGKLEDRLRLMMNGPWLFERQVISLVKPGGLGHTATMNFNWVPFWIHIFNVLVACLNVELFAFGKKSLTARGG